MEQALPDTVLLEKSKTVSIEEGFGHGRIEKNICIVHGGLSHIGNKERWKGLKTTIKIESEVFNKTNGKTTKENRYYISSLPNNSMFFVVLD